MEFINDKATIFSIKVEDNIMRALIKNVVVNRNWLIKENLLPIGVDGCHNLLILGRKVIEAEILILYVEDMGT
jgi:hypothetical protein